MPRKVLGGLIQCANPIADPNAPVQKISDAAIDTPGLPRPTMNAKTQTASTAPRRCERAGRRRAGGE